MEIIILSLSAVILIVLLLILFKINSIKLPDNIAELTLINKSLDDIKNNTSKEFFNNRQEINSLIKENREEINKTLREGNKDSNEILKVLIEEQKRLTDSNQSKLDDIRKTFEEKVSSLQKSNEEKLEQMRITVDEKLQSTLEKRLSDSFNLVSERLELVHKGLGEMQNLATGVGDLKKVLANVKTRGVLGEIQLENILEQFLSPDQYVKIYKTSKGFVEFAIKIPNKDSDNSFVYIPIDSKFPMDLYANLQDAYDSGDATSIEIIRKQLITATEKNAKDICDKYITPPETTDFAVMFLPVEGLFAEITRTGDFIYQLQSKYKITIAGPTTLISILSAYQMGFRSLAIEKRSSEVWKVLGEVKTEFNKFEDLLQKTKKKIESAGEDLGDLLGKRSKSINRKLKDVESLPNDELLP